MPDEIDENFDYIFYMFCLFLIFVGVGFASRTFRGAMARCLRWFAGLLDDGVRAHERSEAIVPDAAEPIAEIAKTLPTRSVNEPAGTINSNPRPL